MLDPPLELMCVNSIKKLLNPCSVSIDNFISDSAFVKWSFDYLKTYSCCYNLSLVVIIRGYNCWLRFFQINKNVGHYNAKVSLAALRAAHIFKGPLGCLFLFNDDIKIPDLAIKSVLNLSTAKLYYFNCICLQQWCQRHMVFCSLGL